MRAVVDRLDEDDDGWPEGSGNVERGGMGVEKLDNSVYLIRGLYDLADMARAKGDRRTADDSGAKRHQHANIHALPSSVDVDHFAQARRVTGS